MEKKYLLVFDDIWNEKALDWNKFISRLPVGVQGSKILVTTRSDIVASVVGVGAGSIVYGLKPLPDDACWSIIEKKAFSSNGAQNTQALIKIGKGIAKKCGGLPVVAKSLGNLLHSRCTESDWVSIRDGSGQITHGGKNRFQSALKLSYDNLSCNLRECFSFCSIFPKNWEISKKTLIQLWMAEGFLEPYNVDDQESIEDIGNEFFHGLVSRSFFHYLEKDELGDIKTCKMHDSLHNLARDVLGDVELASLMVSELNDVYEVRRLQLKLDEDIPETVSENLSNGAKLRTIFIPEASNLDPAIFSGSKHLRVLHVGRSPDPGLTKLRHLSIKLIHLRYLYLSSLDLSEVVNDQSINKLYHLQTLVLTNMSGVQNLLSHIHSLRSLRHLELSFTDMEVLPDSVTSLPNLRSLDLNHCQLKAFPDSITGLSILTFLDMSFNTFEELPAFVLTLSHLQILDINSCTKLKALPESMSGLENLKIFNFEDCPLLEAVPQDLGALTKLRSLDLRGAEIKVLPESCTNLSKLELVYLYKCQLPEEEEKWRYLRNLSGRGEKSSTSQEASTSR